MAEPTERVLDALEESTRVTVEVIGHVKGMTREFVALRESHEKEFQSLRETFKTQLIDLEDEMRSTNAHLNNLVRETQITNQLLREDMIDRKTTQERRMEVELEERTWRRSLEEKKLERSVVLEDDKRATAKKFADEMWGVFKQPFGYLVTGVVVWMLLQYFVVPSGIPTTNPINTTNTTTNTTNKIPPSPGVSIP